MGAAYALCELCKCCRRRPPTKVPKRSYAKSQEALSDLPAIHAIWAGGISACVGLGACLKKRRAVRRQLISALRVAECNEKSCALLRPGHSVL